MAYFDRVPGRNVYIEPTDVHGGYPGEVVVQDEYLECEACACSVPLDSGDVFCFMCEGDLIVKRANPPLPQGRSLF